MQVGGELQFLNEKKISAKKWFKLHKAQAIMSHNLFMLMLYETSA